MKQLTSSTAIAAVMALCGFIGSAHAVTVTENYWSAGQPNAPLYFTLAPSYTPTPTFHLADSGSISGYERSPYELNTNGLAATAYSVLAPGGQVSPAQAIYDLNSATVFALLWGSPDTYNQVKFYSGTDGNGTLLGAYTGASLACYGSGSCTQFAWDVVTFTTTSDASFGSVVLTDTGQAAFEYGLRVGTNQGETPLPAAFWLFGTVIAGTAGASRMRRRRRQLQLA